VNLENLKQRANTFQEGTLNRLCVRRALQAATAASSTFGFAPKSEPEAGPQVDLNSQDQLRCTTKKDPEKK